MATVNRTLVIGYGNTLRGDDGAGVRAAELMREIPGVDVLTVHQLGPEIAEVISRYDYVVLLDASRTATGIRMEGVYADPDARAGGAHSMAPATLLSLCRALYGRVPGRSTVIGIPATTFEFGERLSGNTAAGVREAVRLLKKEIAFNPV